MKKKPVLGNIIKYWSEGFTTEEIAKKENVCYNTVRVILKGLELPYNKKPRMNNIEFMKYYIEGKTIQEMADIFNVRYGEVIYKCKKLGFRRIMLVPKEKICDSCGEIYTSYYVRERTCPRCMPARVVNVILYKSYVGIRSLFDEVKKENPPLALKLQKEMEKEEGLEFVKDVLGDLYVEKASK